MFESFLKDGLSKCFLVIVIFEGLSIIQMYFDWICISMQYISMKWKRNGSFHQLQEHHPVVAPEDPQSIECEGWNWGISTLSKALPRFFSLYLKAPPGVQDLCISWRILPLITSRLFAVHIKKLSCFKLGNTQFWGPLLVFRPTPLGYHPQGRDHQITRGHHEQAIPQYIPSKQHIVYYVRKECISAGDLMFGCHFPSCSHKPGGHLQEWRACHKC